MKIAKHAERPMVRRMVRDKTERNGMGQMGSFMLELKGVRVREFELAKIEQL